MADEGVAFDIEERNVGTCAVAAPVRDQLGRVIAALSVIVPIGPVRPRREGELRRGGQGLGGVALGLPGLLAARLALPGFQTDVGPAAERAVRDRQEGS